MEILIIVLVAVVLGTFIYYNRASKGFDVNRDGKVDAADAKAAVKNVVEGVKATADVNKDGKVDKADGKAVAAKAKTAAKNTANKAKAAVKKTTAKKKS